MKYGWLALLASATLVTSAQTSEDNKAFSNELIWASGTFQSDYVWGIRSMADGKHYTTQEMDP